MVGGLINIVSYGANDLYLIGAPQITFFKIVYRRYTNFAKECISLSVNNINFEQEVQIELPKVGDLVGEVYLQISLPSTSFTKEELGIDHSDPVIDTTTNDNYNIVTDFIKLNATAYRTAYNDNLAINLDVTTMITNINDVFASFTAQPDLITTYGSLLSNDKGITGYYWLDPNLSDISKIILQLGAPSNYSNYTKQQIMIMVQNAMINSIRVQEYYYKKLLEYNTNYETGLLTSAKFAWVKRLGHSMIDYVSVSIGGEEIDRHYGDWLEIWHDLAGSYYQRKMYDKLIGDIPELTTFDRNAKPSYTMIIPLSFWFNRRVGQSFPLVALKYHSLYINVRLKKIEDCMYVEKNDSLNDLTISLQDLWDSKGYDLTCSLLVNYIYLDSIERKRFAQSSHEYLIERVQRLVIPSVSDQQLNILLDSFFSPTKEIIWYAQKHAYVNNITNYYVSMWNNFGLDKNGNKNPVTSANLVFNGYVRVSLNKGGYFNYLQPYAHHSNTPQDGINVYSFSLHPEEYQPSASCNFTQLPNATLNVTLNPSSFLYYLSDIDPSITPGSLSDSLNETTVDFVIHMISYNVVRIVSGMGSLAFQ